MAVTLFCPGCYLLKQGFYVVKYSFGGRSVDRILRDKNTDPELRDFVLTLKDIRRFAVDSVGLRKNRNYTRIVEVKKDYLVDVVSGSRDDSFEQYQWCWPFFGCFPYKGYFNRSDAQREANRIAEKGYDVSVRRADAFSTLGFFADPAYTFMKDYTIFGLASLIIHEQTHATIFLKNQIDFNEELATFIGDEGGLWYVRSRYGIDSEQYRSALVAQSDYRAYIQQIRGLHDELDAVYKSTLPRQEKLTRKAEIIDRFKKRIAAQYDSIFQSDHFRGLERAQINNAFIAARMTYTYDLADFYRLHEKHNRQLGVTFTRLKEVKKSEKDPKGYLRTVLLK